MRHIQKGDEPDFFREWKEGAGENWEPSWSTLQKPEKPELHRLLIGTQGALCCYCTERISELTSHIEHIRPKDPKRFPELALAYDNLLACCNGGARDTPPRQLHCDQIKSNWYDETLFISPLDPECEAVFRFTGRGEIIADDQHDRQVAAETTIKKLNLDCEKLNRSRREAIDAALSGLTAEQIETYYQKLRDLDSRQRAAQREPGLTNDELPPFLPALLHVLSPAS
jgi:uncharacterized protein (TIGR02646 family)